MSYRPYNIIISQAQAGSTAVTFTLTNASGAPVADFVPVSLNASGDFKTIDVSVEADALKFIGVTGEPILNASPGPVVNFGKIENITGFNFGDVLYVSKIGTLTTTVPDIGVGGFLSGDFVIRVGKVSKNQTNPSLKDLIVQFELVGQL